MTKPLPTLAFIAYYLQYSPSTGRFRWNPGSDHPRAGRETGTTRNAEGQRIIRIDGYTALASRIAWLMVHGTWPCRRIITLDGDPLNLRLANLTEEPAKYANADRNVPGVEWDGHAGRWRANDELFSRFGDACHTASEARRLARQHRRMNLHVPQ